MLYDTPSRFSLRRFYFRENNRREKNARRIKSRQIFMESRRELTRDINIVMQEKERERERSLRNEHL